jgi:transposase
VPPTNCDRSPEPTLSRLDLLTLAPNRPDREPIDRLPHCFYACCADSDLLELHRLAASVETWWPEILAFLHPVSPTQAEGTNRVIEAIVHDAHGFATPKPATTHPHRGHLNP